MSVFTCDKNMTKLWVQFFFTKITPYLNISARMSNCWSVSEILKLFKKTCSCVLFGLKTLHFASKI